MHEQHIFGPLFLFIELIVISNQGNTLSPESDIWKMSVVQNQVGIFYLDVSTHKSELL